MTLSETKGGREAKVGGSKRVATVSYKAERIVSDSCKYIYIYIYALH